MKEILGGNLKQALEYFNIDAKQTYKCKNNKHKYRENYEVWELSDDDFDKLCSLKDEDWKNEWGWWRYAKGSNIVGNPIRNITINGKDIIVYYDEYRFDEYVKDYLSDYIEEFEDENIARNNLTKFYFELISKYSDFTDYCCEQWGVSTEKNICAIAVETARLNNIKLSELFDKYQG